jgi:ribonuclease BN (tRNA processing enzyme)
LTDHVKRIEHCGLYVDLISTSMGTVRVGSMPDIAKFLAHHGFREETVVIPNWEASMAGDNYTGEEFILWQAQVKGGIQKQYTGSPKNVGQMYQHLDETFSFFFDQRQISIIKKRWLSKWFGRYPATPTYVNGPLKIKIKENNILISEHERTLYDRQEFRSPRDPDQEINALLSELPRDNSSRECLEIIPIGSGNGFTGIVSNVVVRFGKYVIWIDPCGYPANTLAQHGIHWDDITHIIITHNHEDHIQGFSACLKRAEHTGTRIQLLTAKGIYALLKKQFTPLFPTFATLIDLTIIDPRRPLDLGTLRIESRWNHHFLPYGTLGFRISAGGKSFGYSGDTKFDEKINTILNREELTPQWFAHCNLVFHEVDFDNPAGVHSHWKQVEALQRAISGQVLVYHTPLLDNAPLSIVREGHSYYLD